MIDSERQLNWANQLITHGCEQLASSLIQDSGIGQQVEPLGSLNGYHLQNPYLQVIGALVDGGLQGVSSEEACRTVDIAFDAVGLSVDQGERDVFAYLLITDVI